VTRTTPEPSASAVNTSSSDDSTMRPVREATSIGVPTTTGSRESIGEGSVDASEVEVEAGDPPSPSEGDDVVHDVHVAALRSTIRRHNRRRLTRIRSPPCS
jgi:hypothetical protein